MMAAAKYLSSKPCKRGHTGFRLVSSHACCECARDANRARYLEKKETILDAVHRYRAEQSEHIKALRKQRRLVNLKIEQERDKKRNVGERKNSGIARLQQWTKANPEAKRLQMIAWAAANPGKCNARAAKRRAAKLERTPQWADFDAIAGMYELAQLFRRIGLEIDVDHVIPLQGKKVSGLHVHDNLQLIHSIANKSKSNDFAIL